jgi:hypothetical protein
MIRRAAFFLALAAAAGVGAAGLERLDSLRPDIFAQAAPPPVGFHAACTYATMNALVHEDGDISLEPADGQWVLRMKAGPLEISGTTGNGLLYGSSSFSMKHPALVRQWNYDSRSSRTDRSGSGYVIRGTIANAGQVKKSFSNDMGKAPLDSDFLGFQLAGLLVRGVGSFNADFLVKNRGMSVNADFMLSQLDAARLPSLLAEAGPFRSGLERVLKPGCRLYTIKLTGVAGAFFKSGVYAAFSDGPQPAFLAYWNTNAAEGEGLWIRP